MGVGREFLREEVLFADGAESRKELKEDTESLSFVLKIIS